MKNQMLFSSELWHKGRQWFEQALLKGELDTDPLKTTKKLPPELRGEVWLHGAGRAASKLKEKSGQDNCLADIAQAEMASRRCVAQGRYQLWLNENFVPESAFFPACGAGLDALYLAQMLKRSAPIYFSDISALAVFNTRYQLQKTSCPHFGVVADFAQLKTPFVPKNPAQAYAFADPSRRKKGGGKNEKGDYAPSLEPLMKALENFGKAQIKLAPGHKAQSIEEHEGWHASYIEYKNELLECCASFGLLFPPKNRSAIIVNDLAPAFIFSAKPVLSQIETSLPKEGDVFFAPSPALCQAGLANTFAKEAGLKQVEPAGSLLYTTAKTDFASSPFMEEFSFVACLSVREKNMRAELRKLAENYRLELRVRGEGPTTEIRKLLQSYAKKSAPLRIVFWQQLGYKPVAFLLERRGV